MDPAVVEALALATRIDPTNQGRPRQEKLVGKLLRAEHSNEELQLIQDTLEVLAGGANAAGNNPGDALALGWRTLLLQGDAAAREEVMGAAIAAGEDVAHLNLLIRRATQEHDEAQMIAAAAMPDTLTQVAGLESDADESSAEDSLTAERPEPARPAQEGRIPVQTPQHELDAMLLGSGVAGSAAAKRQQQKRSNRHRKALVRALRRIAEHSMFAPST